MGDALNRSMMEAAALAPKPLQPFPQNKPRGDNRFRTQQRFMQGCHGRLCPWPVAAQRQGPDTGVHRQRHCLLRSALQSYDSSHSN